MERVSIRHAMRLFISIEFPNYIKEQIVENTRAISLTFPSVSWVKRENLHLTLKFLGFSPPQKLAKIQEGIKKSTVGLVQAPLIFGTLGYFDREPFIIWLGIASSHMLDVLVASLDYEMAHVGFIKEKRPFSPHITLGRARRLSQREKQHVVSIINKQKPITVPAFAVKEVALMESKLTSTGPFYTKVATFAIPTV